MTLREEELDAFELAQDDVVVSSHACGSLTDVILTRAVANHCRIAVLPCCQHTGPAKDALSGALALEQERYHVWTQTIPEEITPMNRLLIAEPAR